MKKTLDLVEKH